MIYFPKIRTKRLVIQLRELTIGEELELAAMPTQSLEAATTRMLGNCVVRAEGTVTDPQLWTVQERTLAVTQYLAATSSKDSADFPITFSGDPGDTEAARYSTYLMAEVDYPAEAVDVMKIDGNEWRAGHLLGYHAETIERLQADLPSLSHRTHWIFGRMAAQLFCDKYPPIRHDQDDLDVAFRERMLALMALPAESFNLLYLAFWSRVHGLDHLFLISTDEIGVVCHPRADKVGGPGSIPPARFPVGSLVTPVARDLGGAAAGDGP